MASILKVDQLNNLAGSGYVSTSSGVSLDCSAANTTLKMPKGTTAQRPSSSSGEMRYNTSTNTMEYYNGTRWVPTYEDPDTTTIPTNGLVANRDATLGSGAGYNGNTWIDQQNVIGNVTITSAQGNWSFQNVDNVSAVYNNSNGSGSASGIPWPTTNGWNKLKGTIEWWIKPQRFNQSNGLIHNRSNDSPNDVNWFWVGYWDYANTFYFRLGAPSQGCCGNDISNANMRPYAPASTWSQIVACWDARSASSGQGSYFSSIYVNGYQNRRRTISTDIGSGNTSSVGRLLSGHSYGSNSSFMGHCASIRIWNRPLEATEIANLYSASASKFGLAPDTPYP